MFGISQRRQCLCAFCGHRKKIYLTRRANGWHFLLSLFLSLSFMWSYWQRWESRALIVFFLSLVTMELLIHIKWRLSLICRQCGFDPILYKRNAHRAALKVKAYLERRKNDPAFLTAPAIKVPFKSQKLSSPEENSKKTSLVPRREGGQIISKTI